MPDYKIQTPKGEVLISLPAEFVMVSNHYVEEQKKENQLLGRIAELNFISGEMFRNDSLTQGKIQLRIADLLKRRD